MFFLKSAFCRIYQTAFRIVLPLLPYREPEIVDSCSGLDRILKKEKVNSVLIVTDKGIVENGLTVPITEVLESMGMDYAIYDQTRPNPTVHNVEDAYALYLENHCNCLIAVGGGSSMDCAKAVGARAVYPKKSIGKMKGILRVLRPLPTLIAIPTTAGTGSEKQHKYALMSFPLIPHYAVLDPELTCSLPKSLTATTGMDALTHAVEAYIGRSTTRETRRLALDAVKLVFENIETAYQDGQNRTARGNMLQAAYKAGAAFSQSYVGYIHAVAHSLGGQYGTPHGLANAVIMPYVLKAYGKTAWKKQLRRFYVRNRSGAVRNFIFNTPYEKVRQKKNRLHAPCPVPFPQLQAARTIRKYTDHESMELSVSFDSGASGGRHSRRQYSNCKAQCVFSCNQRNDRKNHR